MTDIKKLIEEVLDSPRAKELLLQRQVSDAIAEALEEVCAANTNYIELNRKAHG